VLQISKLCILLRPVGAAVDWLRDARWLTSERATAYSRILFWISLAVAVAWAILSWGGFDPMGKPLGTDFVSFWTASRLALGGNPAKVYDAAALYGLEQVWFGRGVGYSAFFYPPVFLLICLPLGTLSYMAALGAWLGATGLAYYRIVRAWLGERFGVTPVLAFPAVFITSVMGRTVF
jgi:alpha-1,2-mannosyltransferase